MVLMVTYSLGKGVSWVRFPVLALVDGEKVHRIRLLSGKFWVRIPVGQLLPPQALTVMQGPLKPQNGEHYPGDGLYE